MYTVHGQDGTILMQSAMDISDTRRRRSYRFLTPAMYSSSMGSGSQKRRHKNVLNQISVMGRIVRDPELRRTNSGKPVTSFTLACERDFKNTQTGEKEVDFIDCVAWNSTAEIVEKYFYKGHMAVVTGRLQIRKYTDKNGQKRRQAEILASSVYFCGGKENGAAGGYEADSGYNASSYQTNASSGDFAELEDDDGQLPF